MSNRTPIHSSFFYFGRLILNHILCSLHFLKISIDFQAITVKGHIWVFFLHARFFPKAKTLMNEADVPIARVIIVFKGYEY